MLSACLQGRNLYKKVAALLAGIVQGILARQGKQSVRRRQSFRCSSVRAVAWKVPASAENRARARGWLSLSRRQRYACVQSLFTRVWRRQPAGAGEEVDGARARGAERAESVAVSPSLSLTLLCLPEKSLPSVL